MEEKAGGQTWVVIAPHEMLAIKRDPDELDEIVLDLIKARGPMGLSLLWRDTNCHLWELDASLNRLKRRGLLIESDLR